MNYGKCWQVSWDSHRLTGEGEEQNTDVSLWMYVGFAGFSVLQRHPESSHGNTAGDSEKTNRVKLEEKPNYMQKETDKKHVFPAEIWDRTVMTSCRCVCVCVWWRQEAGGYVTTGGLFPDSFKQNAMACWVQYGRESTRVNAQGSSLRQPDSHTVTWQTEVKGGGDNAGSPPPDSYWLDLYEHTRHLMERVEGESG